MAKTTTVEVKGMTCAACALAVKKAIENTEGVVEANVNLATNKATITFDPTAVDLDEIFKNVEKTGYALTFESGEEDAELKKAKNRLIASLFFVIPSFVMMILMMAENVMIPYMDYINLGIAFVLTFVIGFPVLERAFKALIHGNTNMELLIALGTIASFLTGIMAILGLPITNFSYVSGMIMFFYLLGQYLEALAKGRASNAIKSLIELGAKTARIIVDEQEVEVDVSTLDIGDIMVVRPGDKIPTDGKIIEGETTIDESMATGESIPVGKKVGDEVIGGTVNESGLIKVEVTKVGKDTFLSQLVKLVEEAQGSKVPVQEFADKVTAYFVPTVLLISLATFIFWFIFPAAGRHIIVSAATFIPWVNPALNRISMAVFAAVATLVIACPCALGLATPTALMVGSGLGARNGILIRNGKAIEVIKDTKYIVFDKTGTLTEGKPRLTDFVDFSSDKTGLEVIASLEQFSNHPIAKAIVEGAKEKNIPFHEVTNFKEIPGEGVYGKIDGTEYAAKKPEGDALVGAIGETIETLEKQGKTVVVLYKETMPIAVVAVADVIKGDAKKAIAELKEMGFTPVMLTGDNKRTAEAVSKELGIEEYFAEVFPKDKVEVIKSLQAKGNKVTMVGDGINDAPAIKQADVGIAMGSGSDIAIEAGDIVLFNRKLESVVKAVRLSQETFRKIKQNLFWALFYNSIAIPIASLGLLHPIIAEAAMALSSINVVTNSLRLNRAKL
ncbi:MAG: copper-translocating P-type ATPase [Candidatus Atribacteria bacterium]|nr:copper-translocating P-type ATPase [Candidatus Atribacteria bacterium]